MKVYKEVSTDEHRWFRQSQGDLYLINSFGFVIQMQIQIYIKSPQKFLHNFCPHYIHMHFSPFHICTFPLLQRSKILIFGKVAQFSHMTSYRPLGEGSSWGSQTRGLNWPIRVQKSPIWHFFILNFEWEGELQSKNFQWQSCSFWSLLSSDALVYTCLQSRTLSKLPFL